MMQMTQLTAEVKGTMKACEGMAGIAADVKALTASFQGIKEQLQLIRTDCTEEAGKSRELASKLQETCNQLVAGLQKLTADTPASHHGLTQQTQPVSRAVSAEANHQVQCLSHHESAGNKEADCEPAQKPAKRQGIKSRLTEYRRSQGKAAAPVKQLTATVLKRSGPSAAIQGIYQPSGELQQVVAQPGRGHSGIGVYYQGKEGKLAAERVLQAPASSAASSRGKGFSNDSSTPAPSLKLSLQPLKASSMQPHTNAMAAGRKVPLPASSTADVHAAGEDHNYIRSPAKRRKSQQQYTGFDVFTKLSAQADMGSCEQASTLPVIQEDKIAKEVSERLKMQRMRRMRA